MHTKNSTVMNSRTWLTIFFGVVTITTASLCALSYSLDLFGVFRDARGRSLAVYNNERTAKYLLNEHYVPENFDALIIGSSATANWRAGDIGDLHIYNESIDGGNAAEEKLLVEQALPKSHFRIAVCLIHPYMLHYHALNAGGTGTPSHNQAWLSVNILREEVSYAAVHLLKVYQKFYPDGSKTLETKRGLLPRFPGYLLTIDPVALEDYRALISELHHHGVRVVLVVAPLYEPLLQKDREGLEASTTLAIAHLPHDSIIDFNAAAYRGFRSDPANYDDGIHLSREGAERIGPLLASELRTQLSDSQRASYTHTQSGEREW